MSCLFCKIVAGEIPATKVYEDDRVIAFNDINPQAPMHVLVVPKKHLATLNDLSAAEDGLVGAMVRRAAAIAYGVGTAVVVLRAVGLGTPWLAVAANALGALFMPLLVPPMVAVTSNMAKASPPGPV